MREVIAEFKALRLHGMAGAWADLQGLGQNGALEGAQWLVEHLLQAEQEDRTVRSVRHQILSARFPVHRDLAGFDFDASRVDRKLVGQLASMAFTEAAHNIVLVGGPGTKQTTGSGLASMHLIPQIQTRPRLTAWPRQVY